MNERIAIHIDADLADLVPGFLDNRHKDLERLEMLLASGDFGALRRIGHSMKGVGGGYGFDDISLLGAAIEDAALLEDGPSIREAATRLRDYLARIDVVFDG